VGGGVFGTFLGGVNSGMATATLAQFIALSDQFVALVKAGVPVHLGLPSQGSSAAVACERIGSAVARRVGEGSSVQEALRDRTVPAAYRSVAELALTSGDLALALAGASRLAQAQDESWHAVRVSLRYPLVLCGIAYVGMVLFCLFLVPMLESMYQSMQITAGWGLSAATLLRVWLPVWIVLVPLALLLLVAGLHWSASRAAKAGGTGRVLAWLPGMSKVVAELRSMRFAETLAGHLDAGTPLPTALQTASAAWENDALERETLALADSLVRGQSPSDAAPLAARLPPLLSWAICHADATVGRSQALRMAARLYRESAQRRVQRLRVLAPIVTCLVIGGGVTLLYALALFAPVAQMIQGLAG
jgi:type II secretory pathway component PulF